MCLMFIMSGFVVSSVCLFCVCQSIIAYSTEFIFMVGDSALKSQFEKGTLQGIFDFRKYF